MQTENDTTLNAQWNKRPDDERFLSLAELHAAVSNRAESSKVAITSPDEMKAYGTQEGELILNTTLGPKFFTNWSFQQTATAAGGPAGYLKKLTAPLAAACINEGLQRGERDKNMILVNEDTDTLRAITSPTYGRIWDKQVVEAVMKVTEGGSWQIPAASYATTNPKRATTLYASDRDVFLFLCDPDHPIEVPGSSEPLFRGFYSWNSETAAQTFGIATFLYQRVCDNRIIWGVSNRSELRIRHSSGAPERFLYEGRRTLKDYANESAAPLIEKIQRAQNIKIGKDENEVKEFLKKRGLTLAQANLAIEQTKQDAKDITSAWSITEGITASARSIKHTDTRLQLERVAGKILETVTA